MNTGPWIIAAVLAALSACAPVSVNVETTSPDLNGLQRVHLRAFNGRIRVEIGQPTSLTIIRRGDVEVSLQRSAETFEVSSRKGRPICEDCGVDLEVRVPAGLAQELETSNGEIEVTGAAVSVNARTSNATITARDTGEAGLALETSNGGIEVHRARGALSARTSNAPVFLEQIVLRGSSTSQAITSNASIEVRALSAADGLRVSGATTNGPLNITLPGFDLQRTGSSFTAERDGPNPASLKLETSNAAITVRP